MELWLTVARADGVTDVAIHLNSDATVADLQDALDIPARSAVHVRRTGVRLNRADRVDDVDLLDGDVLDVGSHRGGQSGAAEGGASWLLVCAGGPAAASRIALPVGRHVVGRDRSCDFAIADPRLSRRHFSVEVGTDGVTVADDGSSNGTFIAGTAVTEPTPVAPGQIVEAGGSLFRIEPATVDAVPSPRREGRLLFPRPPRVGRPRSELKIELPPPPDPTARRRLPLTSALVPIVLAPVFALVTHNWTFLAFAAMSPVMVLASHVEERRGGSRDRADKLAAFQQRVEGAAGDLAAAVRVEESVRWAEAPDPAAIIASLLPTTHMWERRPGDEDFLTCRVGWADQPSRVAWSMAPGGESTDRAEAARVLGERGIARNAPVIVNLADRPVVGLAGDRAVVADTARWLVLQLAALHSPRDLVLAAAVDEETAQEFDWFPWLPHARAESSVVGDTSYAVGAQEARALTMSLGELIRERQDAANRKTARAPTPAVVVIVDERLGLSRSAAASLLEDGPATGIHVIWLGGQRSTLPSETAVVVELTADQGRLIDVPTGAAIDDHARDTVRLEVVEQAARRLANFRDATSRDRAGEIPGFVQLGDVLPAAGLDRDALRMAWSSADALLTAPVGRSEAGLFTVSLRHDGPHGLLGGTTGAGKSEFLQTLVASLAAHHAPSHLTFLLVDYKGGAAFKDCVHLPHVVGVVTDLDGHLVSRALVSLNAELHRRERLLAAAGAKDLLEMERRAPEQAPASLLLVVDEFATLAKELPEFVDGVVNVAQRGRSLGIHMLLATQRPAGAINDNIRANTNLRMALRMNDEADSLDVLGVRDAAHLPRSLPGRAFIRTGSSEMTQVQVAYSGGHGLSGGEVARIDVVPLLRGRPALASAALNRDKQEEQHDERPTDLQRLVEELGTLSEEMAVPRQPSPWLPPLPETLDLALLPQGEGVRLPVALADLPARQAQEPFVLDLTRDGSALVLGTSGAGTSTVMRTISAAAALANDPNSLHIYGLDFGNRGLGGIDALPHCGAVVSGDDIDRVQRVFVLIDSEMQRRRDLFGRSGCSSYDDYARSRRDDDPKVARILVLLDSLSGFTSIFEKIDYGSRIDALPRLISDGRALGIHFVISADRRAAVPLGLMSAMPSRWVLRLADPDDYAMVGVETRIARQIQLPAGRGFVQGGVEVQCAVVGNDSRADRQVAALARLGDSLRSSIGAGSAPPIGALATSVARHDLPAPTAPWRVTIGIGERTLAPREVDLSGSHLLVVGPRRSGKSTALVTLASGLAAPVDTDLHLLTPRRSPLSSLPLWTSSVRGADQVEEFLAPFAAAAASQEALPRPVVLVVDDGHELSDTGADTSLEQLVRYGAEIGVVVIGSADVTAAHRTYGGWLPELRKERHALLLQPDPDLDGDLVGIRVPRSRVSVPGRGVIVTTEDVEIVQVAT